MRSNLDCSTVQGRVSGYEPSPPHIVTQTHIETHVSTPYRQSTSYSRLVFPVSRTDPVTI